MLFRTVFKMMTVMTVMTTFNKTKRLTK